MPGFWERLIPRGWQNQPAHHIFENRLRTKLGILLKKVSLEHFDTIF